MKCHHSDASYREYHQHFDDDYYSHHPAPCAKATAAAHTAFSASPPARLLKTATAAADAADASTTVGCHGTFLVGVLG